MLKAMTRLYVFRGPWAMRHFQFLRRMTIFCMRHVNSKKNYKQRALIISETYIHAT